MIARNLILFLLLNILPFLYFYLRFFRKKAVWWKQVLLWLPCVLMIAYTIYLALEPNFIPDHDRIYLLYGYRTGHRSHVYLYTQFADWQMMFRISQEVLRKPSVETP